MFKSEYIPLGLAADILSISKSNLLSREKKNNIKVKINEDTGEREYKVNDLLQFDIVKKLKESEWHTETQVKPNREYRSIELFAGAGGLAIGLENAGFEAIALNEIDKNACKTLRKNRPKWNVLEGAVESFSFEKYKEEDVDLVAGGFPCQAFSYAGNQLGFEDTRGTLFFEFARVIQEVQPKIFLGENVKGLLSHDNGRTLETIKSIIKDLGYTLVEPRVLKAVLYEVPQKRERLFLVGIRNDLFEKSEFSWPEPSSNVMVLKDALKAGKLYPVDAPKSEGQKYAKRKKEILSVVPQGGYWKDLPDNLQREYMMKSYFLGGGKTGMARRLSWEEPSLTLTCSPAQKQTERCHPEETRPLTIREYARVQTFPDSWEFQGAVTSQYKQIGNAVPVSLAQAVGRRLVSLLNSIT